MEGKVRPALVVSVGYGHVDRALVTIVPHTSSRYGSQYEIAVSVPFLRAGAFLVQNVATYPNVRAIRKLGTLKPDHFNLVFSGLLRCPAHEAAARVRMISAPPKGETAHDRNPVRNR